MKQPFDTSGVSQMQWNSTHSYFSKKKKIITKFQSSSVFFLHVNFFFWGGGVLLPNHNRDLVLQKKQTMLCPYLPVIQVKKKFKADNFYLLLIDSFPKMLILGLMYNMALSLWLKYPKKISVCNSDYRSWYSYHSGPN